MLAELHAVCIPAGPEVESELYLLNVQHLLEIEDYEQAMSLVNTRLVRIGNNRVYGESFDWCTERVTHDRSTIKDKTNLDDRQRSTLPSPSFEVQNLQLGSTACERFLDGVTGCNDVASVPATSNISHGCERSE